MGMEPEQEERKQAVALAKAVEIAAVNGLSAEGVRRGCARSWMGTGTLFGAAFVVSRLPVYSR